MKLKKMCSNRIELNFEECNNHRIEKIICLNGNDIDIYRNQNVSSSNKQINIRSHRCLKFRVQKNNSKDNTRYKKIFAFQRHIFIVCSILLFAICSIADGQQLPQQQQKTRNTGE